MYRTRAKETITYLAILQEKKQNSGITTERYLSYGNQMFDKILKTGYHN